MHRAILGDEFWELEIGYGLIRIVDPEQGGDLLDHLQTLREAVEREFGIAPPRIHIYDNMSLEPTDYVIMIRRSAEERGKLFTDRLYAFPLNASDEPIGIQTKEPVNGSLVYLIQPEQEQNAKTAGCVIQRPTEIVINHLGLVIRRFLYALARVWTRGNLLLTWDTSSKEPSPITLWKNWRNR